MTYEYQEEGIDFLTQGNVILADQPGSGKSRQALMAAKKLGARSILVVCPAIAVGVWESEVKKWRPEISCFAVKDLLKRPKVSCHMKVVSYDHLVKSKPAREIVAGPKDVLILDEGHNLKNPTSKRTILIYGAGCSGNSGSLISFCKTVMVLTGTPQLNHAGEWFPHIRALAPHRIEQASYDAFVNTYCTQGIRFVRDRQGREHQIRVVTGTNRMRAPELGKRLRGFWLRREVSHQLPPLRVELRRIPTSMLDADLLARLESSDGAKAMRRAIENNDELALTQNSDHVSTTRRLFALAKVKATVKWALEALDQGEPKVAIWGYHVTSLEKVKEALAEEGFEPIIITGKTTNRTQLVDRFEKDPKCRVGVFQIVAGGTALTMVACRRALFIEQMWTPNLNMQAWKRHHRIGQTKPVLAEILVAPGIDEAVNHVLARKISEIAAVEETMA